MNLGQKYLAYERPSVCWAAGVIVAVACVAFWFHSPVTLLIAAFFTVNFVRSIRNIVRRASVLSALDEARVPKWRIARLTTNDLDNLYKSGVQA